MKRRPFPFSLLFLSAALWPFEKSIAADAVPSDPQGAAYLEACRDFRANGDLKRAIGTCTLCLKHSPADGECDSLLKEVKEASRAQAARSLEIERKLHGRLPSRPVAKEDQAARAAAALRASQQHYLSGVIYFQKGAYAKAREEWRKSAELDPANTDARAGLDRLGEMERNGEHR